MELCVLAGQRGLALWNFVFLQGRGAFRFGTLRFWWWCLIAWNRPFLRYRVHWSFGFHLILSVFSHLAFLQVEDAIQTSHCGEKTTPCVLIACLSLFCFLSWPLGPLYYISAAGPPAGAKISTLPPTHPPPSHRQ